MTPTTFTDRLTYTQAFILTISELSFKRQAGIATSANIAEEEACRAEFGKLSLAAHYVALAWVKGYFGPGAHLDRRSR